MVSFGVFPMGRRGVTAVRGPVVVKSLMTLFFLLSGDCRRVPTGFDETETTTVDEEDGVLLPPSVWNGEDESDPGWSDTKDTRFFFLGMRLHS